MKPGNPSITFRSVLRIKNCNISTSHQQKKGLVYFSVTERLVDCALTPFLVVSFLSYKT